MENIQSRIKSRPPFLIGVDGGTASGKTSVCHKIIELLSGNYTDSGQRIVLLSQDSFYKNLTTEQSEKADQGLFNFYHSPLQVQLSYSQCWAAPVNMSGECAVTISGKVYYGGGNSDDDDDEYFAYCYDLVQDVWSTLPELPGCYFGLGVVKSELVVVGGRDQSYSLSNVIHVLANGKNWRQSIPPMPTARRLSTVVSLPTHLVVAGGHSGSDHTNIVEIYNTSTSQWSEADKVPRVCIRVQRGILCNNTVYLFVGWDGKYLNTVYVSQVDNLTSADQQDDGSVDSVWKELANTPSVCSSPVMISKIAVCGMDSKYDPTQRVHAYSRSMDSWLYAGN